MGALILTVLALIFWFMSFIAFASARGVIHEIAALVLLLCGVVCMTGAIIASLLSEIRNAVRQPRNSPTAPPPAPPTPARTKPDPIEGRSKTEIVALIFMGAGGVCLLVGLLMPGQYLAANGLMGVIAFSVGALLWFTSPRRSRGT